MDDVLRVRNSTFYAVIYLKLALDTVTIPVFSLVCQARPPRRVQCTSSCRSGEDASEMG
jgi:hypothetical protein